MIGLCLFVLSGCATAPQRISVNADLTDCGICEAPFPLGLYHAHAQEPGEAGRYYSEIRDAGFNVVHLWEGQDIEVALSDVQNAGLQAIVHYPKDDLVRAYRNNQVIAAWYLDEEPSHLLSSKESMDALEAFNRRRAQIKAIDPMRPVFAIDGPHVAKVDKVWRRWAMAGDISAHFNYPVTVRKLRPQTPPQRVAQTVTLARSLIESDKPLWFVVQAFGGERRGWRMPTPSEYEAMVYSAVMHGATGIIVFAYDSFVMRDDGILGVHPNPQASYPDDEDRNRDGLPHHVASPNELEGARLLWRKVVDVNAALKALGPWVLSSTDVTMPLVVDATDGRGGDITYLLKKREGEYLLLMQNTGNTNVALNLSLPNSTLTLQSFFENDAVAPQLSEVGGWRVRIGPYGFGAFRLSADKGTGH